MISVRLRALVLFSLVCLVAVAPLLAGTNWTTTGPFTKVIKAVTFSPGDTSVVFAGTFGWGVFKSTDGGAGWVSRKSGLTNTYVRSLLALSSMTVFCGTNDGVFKSTNGGTAWLLSAFFRVSPEFWMNLQTTYDLSSNKPEKKLQQLMKY